MLNIENEKYFSVGVSFGYYVVNVKYQTISEKKYKIRAIFRQYKNTNNSEISLKELKYLIVNVENPAYSALYRVGIVSVYQSMDSRIVYGFPNVGQCNRRYSCGFYSEYGREYYTFEMPTVA